ncbi:hypothetical protein Tco_1511193 [Tanacetum coccineum]
MVMAAMMYGGDVGSGGSDWRLEWPLWCVTARMIARRWGGGGSWVVRRLVVGSDDRGGVGSGGWRWCGGRWSGVGDGMMMVVM